MTAALTLSFMIRNTSPVGWPPLLLMKIIYDGSLKPILLAGLFVFLPTVGLCVAVDSFYYGEYPVFTSYNFVKANLAEGLSKYFGTDPIYYYVTFIFPWFFTVLVPAVFGGLWIYGKDSYTSSRKPYILVLTLTYVGIFSVIPHKEARFLLPVLPFCFLMAGYAVEKVFKQAKSQKVKSFIKFFVVLVVVVELILTCFYTAMQFRFFESFQYL